MIKLLREFLGNLIIMIFFLGILLVMTSPIIIIVCTDNEYFILLYLIVIPIFVTLMQNADKLSIWKLVDTITDPKVKNK